jgi:tetratricopeptide (TPR) repeat protein
MDFVERGQAMVARGQYQDAVKVCRLGLLASPTNLEGRLVLGRALAALRRHDEVLAEMRVALEIDPTNADALAMRGEALLRKGDALQAADLLRRAIEIAPASGGIRALLAEAELAASGARGRGPMALDSFDSPIDSHTKHYPAHRGAASAAGGSHSITKPTTTGRAQTSGASVLAIGDRSGTIELDPELDGIEMDEIDDDPPIDPPVGHGDVTAGHPLHTEGSVSQVLELDTGDVQLLEPSVVGPAPVPIHEPTAAYRRAKLPGRSVDGDFGDEGPTVAREEFPTGVGTSPESPRSKPEIAAHASPIRAARDRADPSALVRSAAAIDDLFPEDESGVSKLEVLPGVPGAAPMRLGDDNGPTRSKSSDMRTIRAGLGMDAVTSGGRQSPLRPAARAPVPAPLARPPQLGLPTVTAAGKPTRPATGARNDSTEHVHDKPKKGKSKATGKPKRGASVGAETVGVRRRPRRSRMLYVYLFLVLAVGAGSVFVGLMWRNQRREQQVQAATRSAEKIAGKDTYDAYIEARRIHDEIVALVDDPATRAGRARVQAAMAAEYGDGLEEARALVGALGDADDTDDADAVAARAYLALAEADREGAQRYADEIGKRHADDPLAPYIKGRVALLNDQPEVAAELFRQALGASPRPLVFVGLGLAEEARGRVHEAIAAFDRAIDLVPGHPAAVIHRARVAARNGQLRDGKEPETTLLQLINGDAPDVSVSPAQRAWAALSLAEVHLARGADKEATKALEQARQTRPDSSWPFTEAMIRGLVRVGRSDDARVEAERAVGTWPDRAEPKVFLARIAIDRRDADAALAALSNAGDISKHAEALAIRGRAHLANDNIEEASKDLDAALELKPDLREAQAARAEVLLRSGNAKAAAAELEALYDPKKPDEVSLEIALAYATALRQTGRSLDARQILIGLEKRPGAGVRVFLELARLERAEGKAREAREYYTRAIQASPTSVEPRLEAALLAFDTGDRPGARDALEALAKDASEDGEVLLEASRVFSLSGAPQKAIELLDRAEGSNAVRWKLARERGRALLRTGFFDDAVSSLERAVSLKPDDGETRLLLIDAHLYLEDEPGARRALRGILKEFPTGAEALLAKGRIDLYKDRMGEALTSFTKGRKVLESERASPRQIADVAQWIGRVHYFNDKYAAARKALDEAVALDPSHADAFYFLGLVELDSRRYSAAMNAFGKSTQVDPTSNPEAWFYLGESAYSARKWKTAKTAFEAYIERRPKGDLAGEARQRLRALK